MAHSKHIASVAACLIVVGLMLLFNSFIHSFRLTELKLYLQYSGMQTGSFNYAELVMKYQHHKDLYENRISHYDTDLIEIRARNMFAQSQQQKSRLEKFSATSAPILGIINAMRQMLSKPPLQNIHMDLAIETLHVAFYYERNQEYPSAIRMYEEILSSGKLERNLEAGIRLHLGFCNAILANYEIARNIYVDIIRGFGDTEASVTAALLLRYMDGFREEIERIQREQKDSVEKGEKLYKLIAYKESLRVLDEAEKTANPAERPRIHFFKARNYEGLSRTEDAVNTYQQLIVDNAGTSYARLANRRIYMIGTLAEGGAVLVEQAKKNNVYIKDDGLAVIGSSATAYLERKVRRDPYANPEEAVALSSTTLPERPVFDVAKIDAPDWQKLEKNIRYPAQAAPEPTPPSLSGSYYRIQTKDGSIFSGIIEKEDAKAVYIRTEYLGLVRIEKNSIVGQAQQ